MFVKNSLTKQVTCLSLYFDKKKLKSGKKIEIGVK